MNCSTLKRLKYKYSKYCLCQDWNVVLLFRESNGIIATDTKREPGKPKMTIYIYICRLRVNKPKLKKNALK